MTEKIIVQLSSGRSYAMRRATFGLIREAENFVLTFGTDFDMRRAVMQKGGFWGRVMDEYYWHKTRRAWMRFCKLVFEDADSGLDAADLTKGDVEEIKKNFSSWQAVANQNGHEESEPTSASSSGKVR